MFRYFVILTSLALLARCKKEQPPAPPPPPTPYVAPSAGAHKLEEYADFWTWVKTKLPELKAVKTGKEPITEQLTRALEAIAPGLVFELGIGGDGKDFELTISADGNKELFPTVQALVAAAPPLPDTKVIAFRPRKAIEGFGMAVGEGRIAGNQLYYVASNDPERKGMIAVELYVPDMKSGDEAMKDAAFMLLEATVGEYDLETKFGNIDIKPAPAKIEAPLKPLKDLPAAVDAWR